MKRSRIAKVASYALTVLVTIVVTVHVHNSIIHLHAMTNIKGGFSWLHGITGAIECYKDVNGQYPSALGEALDSKNGCAASWVKEKVAEGIVTYLPIEENGKRTKFALLYEVNPKRFNVTFAAFGGNISKVGDWSKLSMQGEVYRYVWPGAPHP